MKRTLLTATLYTLITALMLGVGYPLLMVAIGRTFFRDTADGQLITDGGLLAGSRLLGQPFTSPNYFHGRPSSAGSGYDAANSSGSNLAPTSKALLDRVAQSPDRVAQSQDRVAQSPDGTRHDQQNQPAVPVDLVTTSGSGLDPDITPAAAYYQATRIARARGISEDAVRQLIASHVTGRQFGLLGEPRVSVLLLNRDLNTLARRPAAR